MDIDAVLNSLNKVRKSFSVYEKRAGKYQLVAPILHEDGDKVDIYIQQSPLGENYVRICDFGMSLMRLSYHCQINTPVNKKILKNILFNNGVQNENGNLYLDSKLSQLYESVFQFTGCVQKVCSMDYWNKERVRSAFHNDLEDFVSKELEEFKPKPNIKPLSENRTLKTEDSPLKVDWSLEWKERQFYLFGVKGNDKAKHSVIALLEFKKVNLPFISLIVHENIEDLGDKEKAYLIKNADKQYPVLADFRSSASKDLKRLAG